MVRARLVDARLRVSGVLGVRGSGRAPSLTGVVAAAVDGEGEGLALALEGEQDVAVGAAEGLGERSRRVAAPQAGVEVGAHGDEGAVAADGAAGDEAGDAEVDRRRVSSPEASGAAAQNSCRRSPRLLGDDDMSPRTGSTSNVSALWAWPSG